MKVKAKVIVVTGAGGGLGRSLVLHLLAKGARVAMVDVNPRALEETESLTKEKASLVSKHYIDITDQEKVAALPEEVIKAHGTVDGLINNAGIIQPFVPVGNLENDKIKQIMSVNFYGALNMIKAFLPYLMKRPESHIVNVSSMGGFTPFPGQTIYGASKAALKLLTEGLYAELIGTPIKVTIAYPGAMITNIMKNSGLDSKTDISKASESGTGLSPDKAAIILVKAMESDKYRILIGKDSRMLDILYRIHPKFTVRTISKKMEAMIRQ